MKEQYLAMREKYTQPEIMYSYEYIFTILAGRIDNRTLVNYTTLTYVLLNNIITLKQIRKCMEHANIDEHTIQTRIDNLKYVVSNIKHIDL